MLNYKKPRFWIIVVSIVIVSIVGIVLAAYNKSGIELAVNNKYSVSFTGSSYRVNEILYQAPMYSFIYTLDTTPQYCISSDYMLYSKHIDDEDCIMHKGLNHYEISRQELYALFNPPFDNVYEAINQTELIYRVDTDDDNKTFYLVMQLKNGDVLLALGYDNESNRHIRWLFRLEKLSDINGERLVPQNARKVYNIN